jgi:hypothetical protein
MGQMSWSVSVRNRGAGQSLYRRSCRRDFPCSFWLDGEPCAGPRRSKVHARPVDGGDAELTLYETDGNGIAVITVQPGMEYLVNAVTLEPVEPSGADSAEVAHALGQPDLRGAAPRSGARDEPLTGLPPGAIARYRNTV